MAVQLIRRVRDRQPIGIVGVDWSNTITRGLVFCVNRANNKEVVSGISPTYVITSRTPVPGIHGLAETTTGYLSYGRTKADEITGPGTIFSISRLIAETAGFIVSSGENTAGKGFVYWEDNSIWFGKGFALSTTTNNENVANSGVVLASTLVPEPSCASWDGTNMKFYANKKLVRTVANTVFPAGDGSRITRLSNRSVNSSSVLNCATNLVCIWNRALLENEAISLLINPWQIFEPETIPLFYSTVTAQYARPTSDVSTGTWTASLGSDLFPMLDETAASDTDYITTTAASTCEVALGSLSDPASSSGHVVRYRIAADAGGITVRLRQGTTTIATWTHASAPTSLTTYEQTLTGGEADSITDYTALKLQFEATA